MAHWYLAIVPLLVGCHAAPSVKTPPGAGEPVSVKMLGRGTARVSLLLVATLALAGFAAPLEAPAGEISATLPIEYVRALAKWRSLHMTDYDLRLEMSCVLCDQRPVLINVRRGRATDVQLETKNEVFATDEGRQIRLLSVDTIFEDLAKAYALRADRIEVKYDPYFGFPASVFVDVSRDAADDEWLQTVTLKVLANGG